MSDSRDILLRAERVHTFRTGSSARADSGTAILIQDSRIAALGPPEVLNGLSPQARILDLPGATITPGLTDAHIHVTEWALARSEIDLARTTSPVECANAVAARMAGGGRGWVRGRGWNPNLWSGAEPERTLLDRVAPDRPVALQSHDMHALWVNSAALEAAGIDATTPDPAGGRIGKDAQGTPTGLLLENATQLVTRVLPVPSLEETVSAVLAAQAELHRMGITGVHSLPGIHTPEPDPLVVFEALHTQDRLRLRVLHHIALHQLDDALRAGVRSGVGDGWLRTGGVKMFLDGTLGSRTAWMREPYQGADHCGMRVLDPAVFRETAQRAARGGIATTVHAIGDAAVALAFDVLADPQLPRARVPHRIEHVQCCPAEFFSVPARAGITCSMQPAHLITDWRTADRHWGQARSAGTYAFRSLLASGATLAFGSDAPVEPVDPRLALLAATSRVDLAGEPVGGWFPEECITLEEAFRGFTNGPATAAGTAGIHGQLVPGAVADLVAWEGDPLSVTGSALLGLTPVLTMVAGEIVHS